MTNHNIKFAINIKNNFKKRHYFTISKENIANYFFL